MAERRLVTISGGDSALRRVLESRFKGAEAFAGEGYPAGKVNAANVLYLDAAAAGPEKMSGDTRVQEAVARRIPIVVDRPTPELLMALGGIGVAARAAVLTPWSGRLCHVMSLHDEGSVEVGGATMEVAPEEGGDVKEAGDEPLEPAKPSLQEEPGPATPWTDEEAAAAVVEALSGLDEVEARLAAAAADPRMADEVPDNRKWAHLIDLRWREQTLSDPSGEQPGKRQTARFRISATYHLLAADEPVRRKVLNISVGGAGFEPGYPLIRNDDKHRGWAQALTQVKFEPLDGDFGHVEDFVPANTSDQVSVVSGYQWQIGLQGDKVGFNYSANTSHTKQTQDFRTLTGSVGSAGMVFWHNAYMVGGDTQIDARRLFEVGWNDEKRKLFYTRFPGTLHVRSWPGLATQLLKPDSETVWYTPERQAQVGYLLLEGLQGLVYAWVKGQKMYLVRVQLRLPISLVVPFGAVNYDDP